MSHIQSHHSGADQAHDTFLVILKVYGHAIHLWSLENHNVKTDSLWLSCRGVDNFTSRSGSTIRSFVLSDPPQFDDDECKFKPQPVSGVKLAGTDFVTFITDLIEGPKHVSFAVDVSISTSNQETVEKKGTAYTYLDPRFSSLGIQRTPIVANPGHIPIGQLQIEYLIVTNPRAYGRSCPKPDWLFRQINLEAGHRGTGSGRRRDLPEELLENTIAAFQHAHKHGADMCELDVMVSADGVPIVYHDFDVDAVAAQQASSELGKFRIQVNEFTVKQLRDFRLLCLQDVHGCPYTIRVPSQEENNRPFPTLEEVLKQVDPECGMNIEIKWPQMLEGGKMEARRYREINDFVDRIIEVVQKNAKDRRLILESFDADLAIMLRLKQDKFPVIFLSQGLTDKYEKYMDIRARQVKNAVYFTQAFDMAGVDLILEYYIKSGKKLVDFITKRGLVARAWGDVEDDPKKIQFLKSIGLQCITYDRIDLMKRRVSQIGSSSTS